MARPKLTTAERRERKYRDIVQKAEKGVPIDKLADKHDLSPGRVRYIIKEHQELRAS